MSTSKALKKKIIGRKTSSHVFWINEHYNNFYFREKLYEKVNVLENVNVLQNVTFKETRHCLKTLTFCIATAVLSRQRFQKCFWGPFLVNNPLYH